MRRSALLLVAPLLFTSSAKAQTLIQYDQVAADSDAAVTCGFCATEKFGTMFYELAGGGGLPASAFPLSIDSIQVAVASTEVGDITTGYMCSSSARSGTVDATLELYAGINVPATITNLPASGPWPGETAIGPPNTVQLQLSTANSPGSNAYSVMVNTLNVQSMTIPAPNRYVRVVFTISAGGVSGACSDLGYQPPAMSPFRDNNGRIAPRRGFIYQLGLPAPFSTPAQWTWGEDVADPVTGNRGINGDWLIRLAVNSMAPPPDAGVPADSGVVADAGMSAPDASPEPDAEVADAAPAEDAAAPEAGVVEDSGVPEDAGVAVDAGEGLPPPSIENISPDSTMQGTAVTATVVGNDFVEGLTVKIGAISAEVDTLNGSTTIVVDVPPGIAAGVYDVIVTNPDGQSAILADGFEVEGDTTGTPGTTVPASCASVAPADEGLWFGLAALLFVWRRRR